MSWLGRLFGSSPKPALPGKIYTVGIVGESHRNRDGTSRQAEIKRCYDREPVRLVREPDNPHDPLAIAVLSDRGRCIGYISRDHNEWISTKMEKGKILSASIKSLIGGGKGERLGVLLDIRVL